MTPTGNKKKLRSGYTTGSCAAAAAKAATSLLITAEPLQEVTISLPDESKHRFDLFRCETTADGTMASVIKDAGDDPDVTNGAEIGALVRFLETGEESREKITVINGEGVGVATKPGLAVAAGQPAINPVPLLMIKQAVNEALVASGCEETQLEVAIFVRNGAALAEKTLNQRLGIIGGLSILGTTGIVRPVSAKAWTDTIEASMSVARAAGLTTVLLSTGRTSEKAAQDLLNLPEEALVMMGDYLQYGLQAAKRQGFSRIIISAMWAKLLKAALGIPQTHVRHGALEPAHAAKLLAELGLDQKTSQDMEKANTAREIYERLTGLGQQVLIKAVCRKAQQQAQQWAGLPVEMYLVTSEDGVVHHVAD